MEFNQHNTASVKDDDLLDLSLGRTIGVDMRDLASHIQFLRDGAALEFDEVDVRTFAREVEAAQEARRDCGLHITNALNLLPKLAQMAHGEGLELVLQLQEQLHQADSRLDSSAVKVPGSML